MSKLKIELTDIVSEKIYNHLMSEFYDRIHKFQLEIEDEIRDSAKIVGEKIAKELLQEIKKSKKK